MIIWSAFIYSLIIFFFVTNKPYKLVNHSDGDRLDSLDHILQESGDVY